MPWDLRDEEQGKVSTAIQDDRRLLSARLVRAKAEAHSGDPNEAIRMAKEDKANSKKSPAERLAAMLDSAKKLIDSPDNKFPSGFNRQAHTERLNKILANLGNIEPKH